MRLPAGTRGRRGLGSTAELLLPAVLGRAVDAALDADGPQWPAVAVGLLVLIIATDTLGDLASGSSSARATAHVRHRLLRHVLALDPRTAARHPVGDLVARLVSQAADAGNAGATIVLGVAALLPSAGGVVALTLLEPMLGVTFLAGLLLALLIRTTKGSSPGGPASDWLGWPCWSPPSWSARSAAAGPSPAWARSSNRSATISPVGWSPGPCTVRPHPAAARTPPPSPGSPTRWRSVVRGFLFSAGAALLGLLSLAPLVAALVAGPLLAGLALFAAALPAMVARQREYVHADERLSEAASVALAGQRDVVACGAQDAVATVVGAQVEFQAAADRALARMAALRSLTLAIGGWLPLGVLLLAAPWLVRRGLTASAILRALVHVSTGLQPALHTLVQGVAGGGLRFAVTLDRILRATAPPLRRPRPLPGGRDVTRERAPAASRRSPVAVELRGVTFRYGPAAHPVLDGFDLALPDGEHLAVVGPSGAGKSTLAAVTAGLLRPQAGVVRLAGMPVSELDQPALAALRVLIPQEAYVFTGTLAENLRYLRPDADDAEVAAALVRHLLDGEALGSDLQHLHLRRRQRALLLEGRDDQVGIDDRFAAGEPTYPLDHTLWGRVVAEEPDRLRAIMGAKNLAERAGPPQVDEHEYGAPLLVVAGAVRQPRRTEEVELDDGDIGPHGTDRRCELLPAVQLGHHVDVVLVTEHERERATHQCAVGGQQSPDHISPWQRHEKITSCRH